jgi:hypothetical protein
MQNPEARQFVLSHLNQTRWLTPKQLAVIKSGQNRFLTIDEYPPGYSAMTRLLTRMSDPKPKPLIRRTHIEPNRLFYHLPTVKAPSFQNFRHDRDCEDVYAAYSSQNLVTKWVWR